MDISSYEITYTTSMPDSISRRIIAIRYVGILGVVFCHAIQSPFFFLNGEYFKSSVYYEGFINDQLVRLVHSLGIYGLTYGAVPMFFLFSAYLQFCKPRAYGQTLLSRMKSIVLPFALWTAVNVLLLFGLKYAAGIVFFPDLLSSIDWRLWLQAIFGNYSNAWQRGTHCPFIMYQFWFIRDLFVLTMLFPAIRFLMREWSRGIFFLVVFGAILAMGYRPVIVGGDSLFYYSLGAFLALHKIDFMKLLDRFWRWRFAIVLAVCSVAWTYYKFDGNPDPDTPMWVQLSSALLLMKFSSVIATSKKLFKTAEFLDCQAFFLYCAHAPIVLSIGTLVFYYLLPDTANSLLVVLSILANGCVVALFCTGAGILLKRFCPKIFAFATGGRKIAAKY